MCQGIVCRRRVISQQLAQLPLAFGYSLYRFICRFVYRFINLLSQGLLDHLQHEFHESRGVGLLLGTSQSVVILLLV